MRIRRSARANLQLHLPHSQRNFFVQIRTYSDDSRKLTSRGDATTADETLSINPDERLATESSQRFSNSEHASSNAPSLTAEPNSRDSAQSELTLASAFSFQSLRGLFPQAPISNRYSSPKDASRSDNGGFTADSTSIRDEASGETLEATLRPSNGFMSSSSAMAPTSRRATQGTTEPAQRKSVRSISDVDRHYRPIPVRSGATVNLRAEDRSANLSNLSLHDSRHEADMIAQRTSLPNDSFTRFRNSNESGAVGGKSRDLRVIRSNNKQRTLRPHWPKPSAASPRESNIATMSTGLSGRPLRNKNEYHNSNPFSSANPTGSNLHDPTAEDDGEADDAWHLTPQGYNSATRGMESQQPQVTTSETPRDPQEVAGFAPDSTSANYLTHVGHDGTARMVDISAKDSTKRTAIATARVKFSNPSVTELIAQNALAKGDVLSVARIAGIMASKRTADLIPLCHPLAISKVVLDCQLSELSARSDGHPKAVPDVVVYAQVECTGPTGVEMEALTAAQVAALTVYDMCKAVDKRMAIASSLVFKAGGRSGTFCAEDWYRLPDGASFLMRHGMRMVESGRGLALVKMEPNM